VRAAARADVPIETPGGELPAGENDSYGIATGAPVRSDVPLEDGIRRYVDWLKQHPAAQVRTRA
jgi:hypothetical protein